VRNGAPAILIGPGAPHFLEERMGLILLILVIVLLVGAIPTWPYSRTWGPGPSGLIGVILIVLLILLLAGRLHL
jgi:uncharacterized protein DUF3309